MFFEENNNGLIYMRSDKIKARHAFSTRYGGVSTGDFYSLNLGSNRGDDPEAVRENYRRFCALMGAGIDDCAVTMQVHGNEVRVVTKEDRHVCMSRVPYEADGIVTAERSLPIMCFVADCVPALLCDEVNGVIAAVHCGWRSSVADILGVTVEKMCALGAKRENISAAMGAAIGACCFETDADVPQGHHKVSGRRHRRALDHPRRRQVHGGPPCRQRPTAFAAGAEGGEHRCKRRMYLLQPR